jgi:hypothetical protein
VVGAHRSSATRVRITRTLVALATVVAVNIAVAGCTQGNSEGKVEGVSEKYPLHTNITATTFWVGEILDPDASDGSQVLSTYDSLWIESYGGCDGYIDENGACQTEKRVASNGYFPLNMTPLENPFYLDLPYDDINNPIGFADRDRVIPWAAEKPYSDHVGDRNFSYMKNRWVQISRGDVTCYGQIQDAGPAEYSDADYVFSTTDRRPLNKKWASAGLDVSPALNSCLGFPKLDYIEPVDWRFVDDEDVPEGPWTRIITTSQVQ